MKENDIYKLLKEYNSLKESYKKLFITKYSFKIYLECVVRMFSQDKRFKLRPSLKEKYLNSIKEEMFEM